MTGLKTEVSYSDPKLPVEDWLPENCKVRGDMLLVRLYN